MIITLELKKQLSRKIHKAIEELDMKKNTLSKKEYKHQMKQILKHEKKELKEINKKYPFKKEIEKLLQED